MPEPTTETQRRDALHCNPDPELCDCAGSGTYQAGGFDWYDCPHHQAEAGAAACRVCGCTDLNCAGCIDRTGEPCSWIEPDLCSACALEAPITVTRYPVPANAHELPLLAPFQTDPPWELT